MSRQRGIWYYIRNYRFQSIFVRNFVIVLLLVIVPLAGMSTFLYQSSQRIVESEISQINQNSLYRVRDILDVLFRETNLLATQISQQTDTQLFMMDTNANDLVQGKYNEINKKINMFTLIYEYISSVYVYSDKNGYVISNIENNFLDHFADRTWLPFYEQSGSDYSKTLPRKSREVYPFLLSFVKPSFLNARDKIGAVVINIDLEELRKLIQPADEQETHNMMIVDERNNLIYHSDMQMLFENRLQPEILADYAGKGDYSGIVRIGGQAYVLTTATLEINNWTCISLLPLQAYEEKSRSILNYTMWLMLLFAGLGVAVAFLISVRTFQPIRNIIHVLDQLDKRDTGDRRPEDGTLNEVNYISGSMVKTAESKKRIEADLSHRSKLLQEAQASALQAQINPHFIGNSLETINWMAIELTEGQSNEVSATIGTLSQLMQLSLDMKERLVPIEVEVEHASLYLRMMNIRYKDKIGVTWEIPAEMMQMSVVKLSFQPLLENAIQHGIHPGRRHGMIGITGSIETDRIVIRIADNGVGMEAELVDSLNASLRQESFQEAEHIGLKNVNQRIRLNFGEAYGLSVAGKPGEGTTVRMTLPLPASQV